MSGSRHQRKKPIVAAVVVGSEAAEIVVEFVVIASR